MYKTRTKYLLLLQQFSDRKISGKAFEDRFMELWNQDRKGDDRLMKSWPERYDLQLIRSLQKGAINEQEYDRKWNDLWYRGENERKFYAIIESAFIDVDTFCADPDLRDEGDYDEEQLREEVRKKLKMLRQIPLEE